MQVVLWCSSVLVLAQAFPNPRIPYPLHRYSHDDDVVALAAAHGLGDYQVTLEKPLGLILEERDDAVRAGVCVKELVPGGAAAQMGHHTTATKIVPGDVLLQVDDTDVSNMDFDGTMDVLVDAPSEVTLTLGDGLGVLDMPKNVVRTIQSKEDAFFVDAVVRQAVRELRHSGKLGRVVKVEVIVGAGVQLLDKNIGSDTKHKQQQRQAMVRFFAIFSTDTVSTYSCNVSATGVECFNESNRNDNDDDIAVVEITSLSCAKDEGLGRTIDVI